MRYPFSGEIARLALVAIASVSTVGLFSYLATHERDRLLAPAPSSATAPGPISAPPGPLSASPTAAVPTPADPKPASPVPELRRDLAEPPEPGGVLSRETGSTATPEPRPESDVGANPEAPPSAPAFEKAVVKEAPATAPTFRRKTGRPDAETVTTRKRPLFGRATRKTDLSGPLPSKKCGEPEEIDRESPRDPLSDFIDSF